MAFEYIGELLEEAVREVNPVETRGRVEQVVGTIIRAVVPGVKVGELCILRNPWEEWTLRAEVVGFVKNRPRKSSPPGKFCPFPWGTSCSAAS